MAGAGAVAVELCYAESVVFDVSCCLCCREEELTGLILLRTLGGRM